jgi:Dolichyl-phosphate-mannose-protein mannosyltransferase
MLVHLKAFFNAPGRGLRAPWRVFWVALLVRLLYMTLAHTYRIRTYEDHFQFGWEAGRIAQALVHGFGYADPFSNAYLTHTGPTAWLPPLYPLLIAAIFKLFGVYTLTSAWVLLAVNCVFSASTAMATWEIAARCFNHRVAVWSGWLWALYPAAMQYAVRWPWEMSVTTCLFTWVLVLCLRSRNIDATSNSRQPTTGNLQLTTSWVLFGLLWGLIALSNSTLLIFLPICGLWLFVGDPNRPLVLRNATLAALVFLACLAPWTLRNWQTFHAFVPLRSNFGAELYMGNGPGSTGLLMEYEHPFQVPDQLHLYASLGELRYVALRGDAAKDYIAEDPAHFLSNVASRIYFFWASVPHPADDAWYVEAARVLNFSFISVAGLFGLGLAVRNRIPAAGLFACAFLVLPIPYYIVTVHARFRHPIEPLICILGVYLFQSAEPRKPGNPKR